MDFFDLLLGRGDYADPTKMDPNYGVPLADSRGAMFNALGNMGAILMAAGQKISPEQRAAYLAQLGKVGPQATNDMMNAAQRRLLQTQMEEKRNEAAAVQQFGELMKNPEQFRAQTGFDVREFAGMPPREAVNLVRQVQAARLARDPAQAALTAAQLAKTQRELATPQTYQVGNTLYAYDEASKAYKPVASGPPAGGLEGGAQDIILQGARNPALAETPEYAVAFNRLYAPRVEIRDGQVVQIVPEVPMGVPRPRGPAAAAPTAPPAPAPAAQQEGAPAPAPAVPEGRTIVTPGGGSVTFTDTQPRTLSAAEVALKAEEEKALSGLTSAQKALREALALSPKAFAGPTASMRGAIAGVTGGDQEAAVATRQFSSIMTEQVLSQLRSAFGANPTEGERKILLDMQASVNMSRAEREALLKRAIDAVEERQRDTRRRVDELSRGQYSRVRPNGGAPAQIPALPPGFEVIQ